MKRKQLTFLTLALVVMLAVPQTSIAKVPLNIKVDDEFTFEFDTVSISEKVNGTEYADEFPYEEGTQVDVVINDIDDVDTSSGSIFGASNTYVNYTETIDDEETETSSWVDGWNDIYVGYLWVAFLIGYAYLDYGDFEAINDPTFNTTDTGEGSGMPFFATSNTTYYDELEERFEDYDDSFGTTYEGDVDADLSDDEETFDVQYELGYTDNGNTTEGDDWTINVDYFFDIEVDLTQSIVTRFLIDISVATTLGSASYSLDVAFGFVVGGGFLDNLPFDVPGPSFVVAFLAILSLGIVPRLRRRN